MKKRLWKVIIITAAAFAVGCSLLLILRHFGLHLPCVVRAITMGRIKCPTCGATRASMRLLSLDIKGALAYNPMIFFIWLYIIRMYVKSVHGYIKNGKTSSYKIDRIDVLAIIIMVIWAVLRNVLGL